MPVDINTYVDPVVRAVFYDEHQRQQQQVRDLLIRNQEAGGSMSAFICGGRTVSLLSEKDLRAYTPRPVVDELHDEALTVVNSMNRLDSDKKKLRQAWSTLLRRCHSTQEVRDLIPDTLAPSVSVVRGIPRDKDMTFLLQESPLVKIPFETFQNVIAYYLANRLIY